VEVGTDVAKALRLDAAGAEVRNRFDVDTEILVDVRPGAAATTNSKGGDWR